MKISVKYAVYRCSFRLQQTDFFGAGGGLFLVPLLISWCGMEQKRAFATFSRGKFSRCVRSRR